MSYPTSSSSSTAAPRTASSSAAPRRLVRTNRPRDRRPLMRTNRTVRARHNANRRPQYAFDMLLTLLHKVLYVPYMSLTSFGINYDTGFFNAGTSTHEPFDPAVVRRDMLVIRNALHCTAVRITGGDPDRLEIAATQAADAGLEVRFCTFTTDLNQNQ